MTMRFDVHTRVGAPRMKICSDLNNRVGTSYIKMFSDFHNRGGTPHMKICLDLNNSMMQISPKNPGSHLATICLESSLRNSCLIAKK